MHLKLVHSQQHIMNQKTAERDVSLLGITFLFFLSTRSLLGGLLLLLVLVSLGSSRLGQRLLEDLQDLFIYNLLFGLELGQIRRRGSC